MCRCRTWYEINVFLLIIQFAGVRQSITNCISKFIQCEDWMLTGHTSKRVPFNRPRSPNKTSRRFDFPNSSITASVSSVMIEIGEKIWRGSRAAAPRWGVWSGLFPFPVLVESGEGAVPPPQKIFEIFAWKWRILVAFFCHTRDFFRSSKGWGAWPKWPNDKYATGRAYCRKWLMQ